MFWSRPPSSPDWDNSSTSSGPKLGSVSARPRNEVILRDDACRKRIFGAGRLRRSPDAEYTDHGGDGDGGAKRMVCLRQRELAPPSEVRISAAKYDGGGVLGRVQRGGCSAGTSKCGRALRRAPEARMTSLDFELASTHSAKTLRHN